MSQGLREVNPGGRPSGLVSEEGFEMLSLEPHFNNDGISWAKNTADGGFNVWGNTYPAEALPAEGRVVVQGVPFLFPSKEDGRKNNLAFEGQRLEVPRRRYLWLNLLGASENRCEDVLTLVYADGPDRAFLGLADWWSGGTPYFGERVAWRSERAHYPRHAQERVPVTVWFQRLRLDGSRPLSAVVFPDNPAMHIFCLTLTRAPDDPGRPAASGPAGGAG